MLDPAQAQVKIYEKHRDNEALLGFMNPTPEQKEQIKRNCVDIAFYALSINDFLNGE